MNYKLSEESINKILDYLQKKPYNEVYHLIPLLLRAEAIQEGEGSNETNSGDSRKE